MKPLSGKTAIVTGGARGIGAAISRKLAEQGANVVITYSKSADAAEALVKEISATGVKAKAIKSDAASVAENAALPAAVVKEFGAIDILVNNAGVLGSGIIGEMKQEDYEQMFAVNVTGVFALTNATVPHMKSGGRIINISSILGERAIMAGISLYNASKFAVTGFTRSWAHDLGPKNITVNAVQPGPIDTDMNPKDGPGADAQRSSIPLGHYGEAKDIAAAVAFLASPEAKFINGATLNVDGGSNA